MRSVALTRVSVVDAGVRLVQRSGWASLSLRAVAGELGVTPMALYRHIDDSAALMSTVVEAIVESSSPVVRSGDVPADLRDWARRFHGHLARHPGVAGFLLTNWFESPGMLERIDDLLGVVSDAGLDGFDAVAVVNAVFTYVLMRCEAERTIRDAGAVQRSLRTAEATRPLERLDALAEHYTTAEFDAHFEFGLTALIDGMPLHRTQQRRTPRR